MRLSRPPLTRSQVAPQPPPARQSRQSAPRTRIPACTHMTMTRIYGQNICHQCGRVPSLGWLYACRQDTLPQTRDLSVSDSLDSLPTVPDSGSYFEAQAQVAASIGMSASIIKQIIAGAYTFDQIEILLAQRRHVIDTIRRTKNPSTASVPPTPKSVTQHVGAPDDIITSVGTTASPVAQNLNISALPMSPAGTPCNTPAQATTPNTSTSKADKTNSPKKEHKQNQACTYQVCHNCRPFFQDRLAMSFEPALNDEIPALAEKDVMALPVQSAMVVSKLGLRRRLPPSPLRRSEESMDITMHQRDGAGYESFGQETSSDWTLTTTTSSEGDSELSDKFDLSPCPGPGACPVWVENEGCAYDQGLDDGQREISHSQGLGISGTDHQSRHMPGSLTSTPDLTPSKGSSVSLPNPPTTPLTAGTLATTYSYSLPDRSSPKSNKSSESSRGSEVEVEGGVALTEEAVETRTPDISVGGGSNCEP